MLNREENELLTRVGRGTPCGELLRRYWHPVAAAGELTEEKPIKAVKILGEELVVYPPGTQRPVGRFLRALGHCPTSLVYVDGQPLTDRLPLLWSGLLPQSYYLIDEGHVFDHACLSGCLTHAGELSGLHPL